jgi:hypothetical protein
MKLTTRLTTAGIAILALTGAVAGSAAAASNGGARQVTVQAAQSEPTSPDTDAIQQGDQTTPDTGTAAATAASRTVKGEHPGEQEGTGEQGGNSDGPGGHADPAGNVQHEFNGVE